MLTHAVVGVDLAAGWEAVQRALPALAGRLGMARVTLVYVLETGYTAPELGHQDHYRRRLEEAAEAVRGAGLEAEARVAVGRPATVLQEVAEEVGADGLVLGSRGHSALREFFLGSTVLDAARLADRPLVIVPVAGDLGGEGPVLLATDGSAASANAEAAFRRLVAEGHQGLAVHVGSGAEAGGARGAEAARAGARLAELAEAGIATRHEPGDPREAIARLAREEGAALVVVGQRGHNPLRELLLGSTAEAVCRGAGIPVLLVPGSA